MIIWYDNDAALLIECDEKAQENRQSDQVKRYVYDEVKHNCIIDVSKPMYT